MTSAILLFAALTAHRLCNAVDDALMGVTHVFRGEDHLTNRQLLILQALALPMPQYGHISWDMMAHRYQNAMVAKASKI